MQSDYKRKKIKSFLSAYVILIGGIFATLSVVMYIWYSSYEKDRIRFLSSTDQIEEKFNEKVSSYENLLKSSATLISLNPNLSEADFQYFFDTLEIKDKYAGISGLGYAERSPGNEYINRLFTSSDSKTDIAIGSNLYGDAVIKDALDSSIRTKGAVLTSEINGQDKGNSYIMLIYPVYSKQEEIVNDYIGREIYPIGFVYAPFYVSDFINKAVGSSYYGNVEIAVYDGSENTPANLIYSNINNSAWNILRTNISSTERFTSANHIWTINFISTADFFEGSDRRFLPLIFIGGLLFSIVIYMSFKTQTLLRKESEQRASDIKASRDMLAKSEGLKDTILNSMNSHIAVIDRAGKIIAVNKAWRKFFLENGGAIYYDWLALNYIHALESAMAGRENDDTVLHAAESKYYEQIYKQIKCVINGGVEHATLEYPCNTSDQITWFLLDIAHMTHPNTGVVISYTDITERKKLEKQKEDFIGVASHELKTPVTSIKAYAQVLQRRFTDKGDNSSAQLLAKMDYQLFKLTRLISELLDATRLSSNDMRLNLGNYNISELVVEIAEEAQHTTSVHKVKIKNEPQLIVSVDRDRIGQVLINLLSNAIKYSPDATEIFVDIKQVGNYAQILIEDFGIGIPDTDHDKIFQRFHRVISDAHKTFSGLGLGLYISSEIIKKHKGKIWVESKKNGTKFYFTLPLSNRN